MTRTTTITPFLYHNHSNADDQPFVRSSLAALEGKNITKIAAGCYHSVFASSNGMIYVCGRNNHGQLGTGDITERHIPYPIDIFLGKRVAQIASGFYHTIILTGLDDEAQGVKGANSEDLAAPFSSEKVLGMPCLAWDTQSNAMALPLNATKGPDMLDSSAAASDGMLASSLPAGMLNQEQVHAASLIPAAAPVKPPLDEISHPSVASDFSTSVAPYADVCSEVTLPTNAPTNQDLAASATSPHGSSLFSDDGSVRQDKAALFVLAHMERLARPLFTGVGGSVGICAKVGSKVVSANEDGNDKVRYVVDVCPSTFWLLHKLISAMHGGGSGGGLGTVTTQATYTQLLDENRGFMILSCLRILKANLGRLVKMGSLAGKIRDAMCANDSTFGPRFSEDSIRPAGQAEGAPSLKEKERRDAEDMGADDIADLVLALRAIHSLLVSVVESPTLIGLDATALQKEAAEVLVMGIELFYPNQGEIISLLDKLMGCPLWEGRNREESGEESEEDDLIGKMHELDVEDEEDVSR